MQFDIETTGRPLEFGTATGRFNSRLPNLSQVSMTASNDEVSVRFTNLAKAQLQAIDELCEGK